jgi:hypothetical protein
MTPNGFCSVCSPFTYNVREPGLGAATIHRHEDVSNSAHARSGTVDIVTAGAEDVWSQRMVGSRQADVARAADLAVVLLEQVLSGDITPVVALQKWPTSDDELLAASRLDVAHFAADEDLREIALDYAEYQARLLVRRVQELKKTFELD